MAPRAKFMRLAHYSREFGKASHIFLENGLWRVWRVRATWLGECRRVWRVLTTRLGKCWRVCWVLAKPLGKCWRKRAWQDRSFLAQITYFICIKRSSLHLPNSPDLPDSPNLRNTHQTCLLRVWRVCATQLGECQQV
jgi:hypothetical protein